MFSCICRRKTSLSVSIRLKALTVTSCNRSSLTVRLVQLMAVRLGSRRLMHRQTMLLQPWLFQLDALVELAALPADDHLGEAVVAGVDALLTVRPSVNLPAPHKLRLHLHEDFLRNDGFMVIFHIVRNSSWPINKVLSLQQVEGLFA